MYKICYHCWENSSEDCTLGYSSKLASFTVVSQGTKEDSLLNQILSVVNHACFCIENLDEQGGTLD